MTRAALTIDPKAIDRAALVAAARAAFESGVWSRRSPTDRKRVLLHVNPRTRCIRCALNLTEPYNRYVRRTSNTIRHRNREHRTENRWQIVRKSVRASIGGRVIKIRCYLQQAM